MEDLTGLKRKVQQYQDIRHNTEVYRKAWKDGLRQEILDALNHMTKETGLDATIETKGDLENLEAIICSLVETKSGIFQKVNDNLNRPLIKHNGSLVYQQLFNGKILVMITFPFIEGYGEPQPPKTVAIYRTEELKTPFYIRHMEEFLKEVTKWEDYDDDDDPTSKPIGFNLNLVDLDPT